MSSQDVERTPILYHREQQGLRLLELPPELLEALTSSNPPRLVLKSAGPPADSTTSKPSHIVLCAPDQTYEIRQVQTSNQVYILRPSEVTADEDIPRNSMTAFATCTNTLELAKLDISTASSVKTASRHIFELLPTYYGDGRTSTVSKEEVFSNTPYSEGECEEAWRSATAFVLKGGAYKPASGLLLSLWKALSESLVIEGTSAANVIERSDIQPIVEGSDYPQALWDAILHHLESHRESDASIQFDKETTVTWLGEVVLAALHTDEKKSPPLETWKSLLPEQWRDSANRENLSRIRLRLEQQGLLSKEDGKSLGDANAPPNATTKRPTTSRNWHERLKRPKK